jgi:hypothetical protein
VALFDQDDAFRSNTSHPLTVFKPTEISATKVHVIDYQNHKYQAHGDLYVHTHYVSTYFLDRVDLDRLDKGWLVRHLLEREFG